MLAKRMLLVVAAFVSVGWLGVWFVRWVDELPSFAGQWEGTLVYSVPSQDRSLVADVSTWNGGATTGFQTCVNLRPASQRPAIYDRSVLTTRESPDIRLVWKGNTRLTVECDPSLVLSRDAVWRDVTISVVGRGGNAPGPAAPQPVRRR